jgi:L-fuconolactonase
MSGQPAQKPVEAPLEPDLPIIDPHHHLWPEPPVPGIHPYGEPDLLADKTEAGHNILATVFMEAWTRYRQDGPEHLRSVGETEYVDRFAREAERRGGRAAGVCAGIVANADMMLGDAVQEVLDAHAQASPERLRGIRHLIANDRDYPGELPGSRPGILLDSTFRAAFAHLAPRGLTFDVWLMHPQLPELADLAAAFPETTIVLNHVGSPMGVGRFAQSKAAFDDWRTKLALVAQRPNVMLKLGGLHMDHTALAPAPDQVHEWSSLRMAERHGPYYRVAIDLFGPDRCMFETNFPVDRTSTSANVLWNCFKRVAQGFSASEKAAMFTGVAQRVYRLKLPSQAN